MLNQNNNIALLQSLHKLSTSVVPIIMGYVLSLRQTCMKQTAKVL